MLTDYGKTQSLWMGVEDVLLFHPLESNKTTDVCVIGAGIAGLMTAYMLANDGRRVTIVDARGIAGGETARTTAHLASALDDRFYELEKLFGVNGAEQAYRSHAQAIDLIEKIAEGDARGCEFTRLDGYLFPPGTASPDSEEIEKEFSAATRAGVPVERVVSLPLAGFEHGTCAAFSESGAVQSHSFRGRSCQANPREGRRILHEYGGRRNPRRLAGSRADAERF